MESGGWDTLKLAPAGVVSLDPCTIRIAPHSLEGLVCMSLCPCPFYELVVQLVAMKQLSESNGLNQPLIDAGAASGRLLYHTSVSDAKGPLETVSKKELHPICALAVPERTPFTSRRIYFGGT